MASIYGILNVSSTERVWLSTLGQGLVFDAINSWLDLFNADLQKTESVFVDRQTEDYKERFLMPGTGYMAATGRENPAPAVQRSGYWDVAYPLWLFEDQLAGSDVDMAYMTVRELDSHLKTIAARNIATHRYAILHHLLDDQNQTWSDWLHGSLTLRALANGAVDSVTYPPVIGSTTEATEDHYLELGATVAAIAAGATNPLPIIYDDLIHHFGYVTGNAPIIVFTTTAIVAKLAAISGWYPVPDNYITMGEDTGRVSGYPTNFPGTLVGRMNGCWVVEWAWMPATYMLGVHMGVPRPLIKRVHPADTGLPSGLHLKHKDVNYPIQDAYYADHFGFAVGNRLNGVVMECADGGTYTIPTSFDNNVWA